VGWRSNRRDLDAEIERERQNPRGRVVGLRDAAIVVAGGVVVVAWAISNSVLMHELVVAIVVHMRRGRQARQSHRQCSDRSNHPGNPKG